MSLHYLVKLEMFITQVLPVHCQKETSEFIPSQLWPPNSPDLNPIDNIVWEYCKRKCTKHASLIWMNCELKQRLRMEWAKLDHVVIVAAIHQWHRR